MDKKELERLLTSVLNGALAAVREANIKLSEDVTSLFTKKLALTQGRGRNDKNRFLIAGILVSACVFV
ncbi:MULTISPECIES: hypothetical protein [Methylobacter]